MRRIDDPPPALSSASCKLETSKPLLDELTLATLLCCCCCCCCWLCILLGVDGADPTTSPPRLPTLLFPLFPAACDASNFLSSLLSWRRSHSYPTPMRTRRKREEYREEREEVMRHQGKTMQTLVGSVFQIMDMAHIDESEPCFIPPWFMPP